MPCAAEARGQIGEVESLIRKVKQQDARVMLNSQSCEDPTSAVVAVIAAHNQLDRVQGEDCHDEALHGAQGTPGHAMQKNLKEAFGGDGLRKEPKQGKDHEGALHEIATASTLSTW